MTTAAMPTGSPHHPAFLGVEASPTPRFAGHHAALTGTAFPARGELPWSPRHTEAGGPARTNPSSSGEMAALPVAHAATHATPPLPVPMDVASAPVPAPLPAAPAALLAYAAEDFSLRVTVMPESAVLSVDTGAAGELAVHLRVKDGVTDVHVSGAAVASLDVRPEELRTALAGEGLTLGSFESGQSPPQQTDVDPRDEAPAPRNPPPPAPVAGGSGAATSPIRSAGRGVHITA